MVWYRHRPEVDADAWGPDATDEDLAPVSVLLAELVSGAGDPIIGRDIRLYTNTPQACHGEDDNEDFIIDRWLASRLIVCSGRGAKFAPAIGERLARLALDPAC